MRAETGRDSNNKYVYAGMAVAVCASWREKVANSPKKDLGCI